MIYFLQEQSILQEADIKHTEPGKAIFRMVIQTADDENRNRRIYPRNVLENAIGECRGMMSGRNFYGELDHPLMLSDQVFNEQRQTTVLLKEVSHIIRDCEWQGNLLVGEFETLSTPNGNIALGLIKDKTTVGTSMRGLAELEKHKDYNVVKDPLTIITYDLVSRPSHQSAVIDEKAVTYEQIDLIKESANNRLVCTPDGKCYLADHFDKLVESNVINFFNKWV